MCLFTFVEYNRDVHVCICRSIRYTELQRARPGRGSEVALGREINEPPCPVSGHLNCELLDTCENTRTRIHDGSIPCSNQHHNGSVVRASSITAAIKVEFAWHPHSFSSCLFCEEQHTYVFLPVVESVLTNFIFQTIGYLILHSCTCTYVCR